MSFLDTLKKTAGIAAQVTVSAADTAVSKTRTMASIGRVKLAISSEEDKLKKAGPPVLSGLSGPGRGGYDRISALV